MAVNPERARSSAAETDQRHRYEISTAMNAVVRACGDVVREHSHRSAWIPAGTPDRELPPGDLAAAARRDVLDKLRLAINCAETVIGEVERERARNQRGPGSVDD